MILFLLQSLYKMIEEKLSIISDEKLEVENILRKANTEFPNDEDVLRLYEKYCGVSKETILLQQDQIHVDDFHAEDGGDNNDDGGNNNDGGENVDGGEKDVGGNNNDGGKKDIGENIDGSEKDVTGENIDPGNEKQPAEAEEEEIFEVETFIQWIEANIDWVKEVIDCICDAYHDVLY